MLLGISDDYYGYSIIHHFRGDMRGGGTALIYKTGYTMAVTNLTTSLKSLEYTAATIKTATSTKVLFIIIYRTGPLTSLFNQELDALLSLAFSKCDSIVVAGDLNLHFNVASNNGIVSQTLNVLNSYGMVRQIYDATHINGGSLDQIFTFSMNKQLTCTHTIEQDIRLGSDHFPVLCNFSFALVGKYFKSLEYRDIKNMDTASFSDELVSIVKKLREECPWDMKQTHESLSRHLIEEAYELLDALASIQDEDSNYVLVKDELGDLLLQILLHSKRGPKA